MSHSKVGDEIITRGNFSNYGCYNNFLYYNTNGNGVLRLNISGPAQRYTYDIYFSKTTHVSLFNGSKDEKDICYMNEFDDVIKYKYYKGALPWNVHLTIRKYNNIFYFYADNNFYYINGDTIK